MLDNKQLIFKLFLFLALPIVARVPLAAPFGVELSPYPFGDFVLVVVWKFPHFAPSLGDYVRLRTCGASKREYWTIWTVARWAWAPDFYDIARGKNTPRYSLHAHRWEVSILYS